MEEEESVDPERLLQCPYVKYHKIRSCRLPYHLVKCRKNHPDIAAKFATCPFNARHLVLRDQLSKHITTCMDKTSLEDDVVNITWNQRQDKSCENAWQYVSSEEDWDKESLEHPSPSFVWGTMKSSGNDRNHSENKP
ncbi:gametocyte-specific factor 1-like [Dipodomys merriami]|uniref:gametocyte-specific factor 1-like n=1 Tax=Dipodomys merriami TaxID=94247 RepID=UPI0038558F12